MRIKIIVATHKEYKIPTDEMYLPLWVGASISNAVLDYQRDDRDLTGNECSNVLCSKRHKI